MLALAKAIAVACDGQRVTWANCRRYVTRDFLTKYRIRRNTAIEGKDWMAALYIAQQERSTRAIDGLPFAHVPDHTRIKFVHERMLRTLAVIESQ